MSSGLSYAPPLYYFDNINYDPEFFVDANGGISQSYADATYLKRTGVAISTATITIFNGPVQCNGSLFISGGLTITGGLTLDTLTMSGLATFNGPSTFNVPPTMSGANITSNTIPALSIANSSLTQTQVSSGLQFVNLGVQNFSGSKTFNNLLNTTGISDTVSIATPIMNAGYYNATNALITSNLNNVNINGFLNCNIITNSSSTAPYTLNSLSMALPTTTTATSGLQLGWNAQTGQGETDFINCAQAGNGGFSFSVRNENFANKQLASLYAGGSGLRLYSDCGSFRIDDVNNGAFYTQFVQATTQLFITSTGINTQIVLQCGNATGITTNAMAMTALIVQPFVNFSPASTTTFNAFHPTTTLGNNISTNTTQYATVGFVNANSGASILPLANTFTGSNTFQLPIISSGLTNYSASLPIAITFPLGSTPLPATTTGDLRNGFLIGWNGLSGSNGETDFTNLNQGGNQGGFLFGNIPVGSSYQKLASLLPFNAGGLYLRSYAGQIRLDDYNGSVFFYANMYNNAGQTVISSRGISTSLFLQCGDGSANPVNALSLSSSTVSSLVNFSPASTTTFNAFHPTTTLGNNISTNTTQYSTVGYVNANSGTALLASNNTWTGNNNFYGSLRYINIGAPSNALAFGASTGNSGSIIVGDSSSLATTTTSSGNICIAPPLSSSLYTTTGSNNICVGALSATAITTGNNNLIYGTSSGTGITTGSLNTVIGAGAWPTGNFSNCTVIGAGALAPDASNQIVLGRTADTVLIRGASQINDTLMTGTTVVSNNMQVNGNIIQPIGTIYTAGVNTIFLSIPPYILYLPAASMNFTLPAPSAANAGMQFIIRRTGVGSSSTVSFLCSGSPAVWVTLNANAGITSFAVASLSASQSMWFSSGTLFYQLI